MENKQIEEIEFEQGQASRTDLEDMAVSWLDKLDLGDKYTVDPEGEEDKEGKVNSAFIKDVKKKVKDEYEMDGFDIYIMKIGAGLGSDNAALMVDPNAEYINEYFVGNIFFSEGKLRKLGIKYYSIHWSNLATEHRGKGLAKGLYSALYEYASKRGYALSSDQILFEGSAGVWTNYIPQIASFFGIVKLKGEIIIPLDDKAAKVNKEKYFGEKKAVRFIAMENPPPQLNELISYLNGLSYTKGEISVFDVHLYGYSEIIVFDSTQKETTFPKLIKNNKTIIDLLKEINKTEIGGEIYYSKSFNPAGSIKKIKAAIFNFADANILVKEEGNKLISAKI